LDKVKTAFDEMNADEDTPPSAAEVTSESPSTADTDPENRDQEKDTP
jgi:hypothetical protein